MRLKGKVAIITGAGDIEGIGAAIAIGYAKEGAKILIADIVDGKQVVRAVEKAGGKVIFTKTDVTQQDECDAMAKTVVDRFGTIDQVCPRPVRAGEGLGALRETSTRGTEISGAHSFGFCPA